MTITKLPPSSPLVALAQVAHELVDESRLPPVALVERLNEYLAAIGPKRSSEELAALRSDLAATLPIGLGDAEGVVAQTMLKYNLARLDGPEAARAIADRVFAQVPVQTELAGYSDPKLEAGAGYEYTALLSGMAAAGRGKQGFVSGATCEGIDGKVHEVSQRTQTPELAITAKEYLGYIEPTNLTKDTDQAQFVNAAKFYLDSNQDYRRATALASNGLVVAGGADVAGKIFREQIQLGRPVALVDDGLGYRLNPDIGRLRSENASAWIADKLFRFKEWLPLLEDGGGKSYDAHDVLANGKPALEAARNLKTPSGEEADKATKTAALQAGLERLGIPVEVYTEAKMFEKTGITPRWLRDNAEAFARVEVFRIGPNMDQRDVGSRIHRHLKAELERPSRGMAS